MNPIEGSLSTSEYQSRELHRLIGGYFRAAAIWGWVATALQVVAVLVAAVPSLRGSLASWVPVLLAFLAYVSFIARLISDRLKAGGDALLRRFEDLEGLGKELSAREMADAREESPIAVLAIAQRLPSEPYFASAVTPPARAVANTYESAWWTARLSKSMVRLEVIRIAVLLITALLVLRAATLSDGTISIPSDLVEVAAALILFLITQGPLRRALDFQSLSSGAERTVLQCERYLDGTKPVTIQDALEVLMGYQLVRKGSPLIPTLLWKLKRDRLNNLWSDVDKVARFRSAE